MQQMSSAASASLRVKVESGQRAVRYVVFNILGKPVWQGSTWPSHLENGYWVVRAYGARGENLGSTLYREDSLR